MVVRINHQDNVVTAGKFDPLGGDSISLRQKIQRLSTVVSSNNLGAQLNSIKDITSDMKITVAEKVALKEEWEHIKDAFNIMSSNVEEMGLESTAQYINFVSAYQALASVMESILSDMKKDTILDQDINVLISAYNQSASILNSFITTTSNALIRELSKYSLDLEIPITVEVDGTVTANAIIRYFNEDTGSDNEITDEQKQKYLVDGSYPNLYIWKVKGTKNDSLVEQTYRGKRSLYVSAKDFSGDILDISYSAILKL